MCQECKERTDALVLASGYTLTDEQKYNLLMEHTCFPFGAPEQSAKQVEEFFARAKPMTEELGRAPTFEELCRRDSELYDELCTKALADMRARQAEEAKNASTP